MTIINSQLGGTKPTGTKLITTNGTHDVAGYANADVQVPTTAPAHYIKKDVDANGKLINSNQFIDLTGVTDIGENVLKAAYTNNSLLSSINMGSVTKISGNNAFQDCFASAKSLTSVNFSPVQEISGNRVFQNAFGFCNELQSFDANSITKISGGSPFYSTFSNCSNLKTCYFNGLNVLLSPLCESWGHMFDNNCKKLEDIYFGGLTSSTFISRQDQLNYIFSAQTAQNAPNGCTVHFPSNFDPTNPDKTFDITTLAGYPTFGGDANYIHLAYDLPATES